MNTETLKNDLPKGLEKTTRALRVARVIDKTGLSRTQIYRLVKTGSFPAPIKLSAAISAWDESAIDAWLKDKFQGSQS